MNLGLVYDHIVICVCNLDYVEMCRCFILLVFCLITVIIVIQLLVKESSDNLIQSQNQSVHSQCSVLLINPYDVGDGDEYERIWGI